MRLSRCSENVTASIRSLTSSTGPRSCSRARPSITDTACSRPSTRAWASSWRSPRWPSVELSSRCSPMRAEASPRAIRDRRRMSRSRRPWATSASRRSSASTVGSASLSSMLRSSASSRATSGSAGGRIDGARAAMTLRRLDPRQQFPRSTSGNRHPRPDLGQGVAVDRGMGSGLDRAQRRLVRHCHLEPTTDSPACGGQVAAMLSDECIDVSQQDLVDRRSAAGHVGEFRGQPDLRRRQHLIQHGRARRPTAIVSLRL